jgi:hypothetical protein
MISKKGFWLLKSKTHKNPVFFSQFVKAFAPVFEAHEDSSLNLEITMEVSPLVFWDFHWSGNYLSVCSRSDYPFDGDSCF